MTINPDTLVLALSMAALLIGLFLRIEHRLTKIETKLDLHLQHDAKRQSSEGS